MSLYIHKHSHIACAGLPFSCIDSTLIFPPGIGPTYACGIVYVMTDSQYVGIDMHTNTVTRVRLWFPAVFSCINICMFVYVHV